MHEIDDFDYYVITDRSDFLSEGDYVSSPDDLWNNYKDIFEQKNAWLDNIGWL